MMKREIKDKENMMLKRMEKEFERVFHPKLEGHNNSIKWVFERVINLGAEIGPIDKLDGTIDSSFT